MNSAVNPDHRYICNWYHTKRIPNKSYETNKHSGSVSFQPKCQLSPDHLEFGKHVQQKQDYCLKNIYKWTN